MSTKEDQLADQAMRIIELTEVLLDIEERLKAIKTDKEYGRVIIYILKLIDKTILEYENESYQG